MASTALEERINKIRLRNEEIKRRYEEVEADKKNAAKLDALIEPIPTEEWPERKEPPEFSRSAAKHSSKPKNSSRKQNDQPGQYYPGSGEGKKNHSFADGQGPPPDPKYNFLADSEREENANEIPRDTERNRGKNRTSRGGFKRRGSGREWHSKEHWNQHENPRDMTHPEYEAWRAERNRIDEARISRQRTAEGNWRREWDNDKIHLANDVTKHESLVTLGDVAMRQEHNENEKYYRSPRTITRNTNQFCPRESHQASGYSEKGHVNIGDNEKRHVIATDKSMKILVNAHGTTPAMLRSSVMSVKVSSTNIAGTGRVGPRQRPRVMYSSQSEGDSTIKDSTSMTKQKFIVDETTRVQNIDQTHKIATTLPKSPQRQRKSDGKSLFTMKKDSDRGAEQTMKILRKDSLKSPHTQRRGNSSQNYSSKSPRFHRKIADSVINDSGKSSRAQDNLNAIDTSFVQEFTKLEDDGVNPPNALEASAIDEKSRDSLGQVERKDYNNESLEYEKFGNSMDICIAEMAVKNYDEASRQAQVETVASQVIILKSLKNDIISDNHKNKNSAVGNSTDNSVAEKFIKDNDAMSIDAQLETVVSPTSEIIVESSENDVPNNYDQASAVGNSANNFFTENSLNKILESTQPKTVANSKSKSLENDITENQDAKKSHTVGNDEVKIDNSLDNVDTTSSDNEAINCSANSGLTSNDSGFIELPNNNSLNDVSDNSIVEKIDENCSESMPSTSRADENHLILETHQVESKIPDSKKNISKSNDLEMTLNTLQSSPTSGEVTNVSHDTESEKTIKFELHEKDVRSTEKAIEIPVNREELKICLHDESANVTMRPNDVAQKYSDESVVGDSANFSDHENAETPLT